MISRTRSRIATSNPSRREPSWPTSLTMLAFAMAYSSCALNLQSRDSGLSPLLTSQENTPSLFLQESGRSREGVRYCVLRIGNVATKTRHERRNGNGCTRPVDVARLVSFFPSRSAWTYLKRFWSLGLLERRAVGKGTLHYRISEVELKRLRWFRSHES